MLGLLSSAAQWAVLTSHWPSLLTEPRTLPVSAWQPCWSHFPNQHHKTHSKTCRAPRMKPRKVLYPQGCITHLLKQSVSLKTWKRVLVLNLQKNPYQSKWSRSYWTPVCSCTKTSLEVTKQLKLRPCSSFKYYELAFNMYFSMQQKQVLSVRDFIS